MRSFGELCHCLEKGRCAVLFVGPYIGQLSEPCEALQAAFEGVAALNSGGVKFETINVHDLSRTREALKLDTVPQVWLCEDGKMKHRIVGFQPTLLVELVEQFDTQTSCGEAASKGTRTGDETTDSNKEMEAEVLDLSEILAKAKACWADYRASLADVKAVVAPYSFRYVVPQLKAKLEASANISTSIAADSGVESQAREQSAEQTGELPAWAEKCGSEIKFKCGSETTAVQETVAEERHDMSERVLVIYSDANREYASALTGLWKPEDFKDRAWFVSGAENVKECGSDDLNGFNPKETTLEKIKRLIGSSEVMVFIKGKKEAPYCKFSKELVFLLNQAQIQFDAFDIFEDPALREALKAYSNWPTYPQVYVNGRLVGGLDVLKAKIQEAGGTAQLKNLLLV